MSTPTREAQIGEARDIFEKEVGYCEHQCTSNCRRVGCNCQCGEFHEEDKNIQFTNWVEDNQ